MANIRLFDGCLTSLGVDAIINPAHQTLLGGGGCDGQVHRRAGIQLFRYCQQLPTIHRNSRSRLRPGEALISPGFNLYAKNIIHCLAPTNKSPKVLENTYNAILAVAEKENCEIIGIPCIGTGAFRFPQKEATRIAVQSVTRFLARSDKLKKVIFRVYREKDRQLYQELLTKEQM